LNVPGASQAARKRLLAVILSEAKNLALRQPANNSAAREGLARAQKAKAAEDALR
jgi:hypothetical protein